MLKKLRTYMPPTKFRQTLAGLFESKLIYGMCVWTGVWGIPGYLGLEDTKTSITKKEINRLQSIQNKTLRLINGADRSTPTHQLLRSTAYLSVHQLGAYHTLLQVNKIRMSKKPKYHFDRLFGSSDFPQARVDFKLCLCRGSFFYQGSKLWSALPTSMKNLSDPESFKKKCKQWIKTNIKIKP